MTKLALTLTGLREASGDVHPEPTEPQKDAGNYKKGHVRWKGLGLTIESAKGQYRCGVTKDGTKWKTLMKDCYGYIKRTVSEADGDHIDIFLCADHLDSEIVFVVNQYVGGKFDEHKCVLGCITAEEAEKVYYRNYQAGWDGCRSICAMTLEQFKWWIEHGDTSKEIEGMMFAKHKRVKAAHDLWEYDCPKCGGTAYNGNPETGDRYRGSGECADCGHSFSIVGMKLKPREKQAVDAYEQDLIEKRAALLMTPDPMTKIANADGAPYRERAELYSYSPQHGIYGGQFDTDKTFAVPGGGVDEGEDIAMGAAREFLEETGMKVKNPRLLPIEPVTTDWSPEHRARLSPEKQKYRGSRTHFVHADPDDLVPGEGKLDQWGAGERRFYTLDEALGMGEGKTPLVPNVFAARMKALEYLKAQQTQRATLKTYVPRSALDSVRQHGMLSGESLLQNPDALAAAAAGRGEDVATLRDSITSVLKGWKPESGRGVNALFAAPPKTTTLHAKHPFNLHDMAEIGIDLDALRRDVPGTTLHGQELMPYADYMAAGKDDVSLRHRDLSDDDLSRFRAMSPEDLWKHYSDPENRGMYAPDVPHVAIKTPGGVIPTKYLRLPEEAKPHPVEKQAALLPTTQLRPHQQEVEATGLKDNTHLLLYHDLGSGKSLSSLAAAEATGDPYTAVTPASLRPNYRKEQEKFTDQTTPNNLVSYNSVAKGQVPPTDTVIFDEAQRLRNPNSLTTQNATELADQAKRVYLLSGTPIVNRPNELSPMIRMLTGKNFSPEQFDAKFVDERKISPGLFGWLRGVKPIKAPQMKNKEEFEDLLKGHVNYFAPDKPAVETNEEHIVTDMGPEQSKLYKAFWDQLPWVYRWKLQNSYPLTRQEMTRLSSFLSGPRQVGLSTLPFMRGKADPLRAFNQSPKLQRAMSAMKSTLSADPNARGMIFSNFIDAGLKPYGAALDQAKIPYGMFHGGLNDAARKKVVDDYNTNKIRAILVGPSGGEGISLKGTRLMQILDPHWNSARTDQAVGRGVRFDSHNYLDPSDRNVKVQRYVSQLPPSTWQRIWRSMFGVRKQEDARRTSPGVDTYLEQMAERKDGLNEQFLQELQRIGSMSRLDKAAADAMAEELAETMRAEEADERPYTVAVDLDGTLAETLVPHDVEKIGPLRPKVKAWMDKFRDAGARLIIFTVRDDDALVGDWLEENEIPYDYINENPDQPDGASGKIIADLYLDDRAVDASGDWDEHGKVVLQRVKAASTVTSREPDLLDSIVAELTNGSACDSTSAVAV